MVTHLTGVVLLICGVAGVSSHNIIGTLLGRVPQQITGAGPLTAPYLDARLRVALHGTSDGNKLPRDRESGRQNGSRHQLAEAGTERREELRAK